MRRLLTPVIGRTRQRRRDRPRSSRPASGSSPRHHQGPLHPPASTTGRHHFDLAGPIFPGEEVYATCIDTRGHRRPRCSPARSATTGVRSCGGPTTSGDLVGGRDGRARLPGRQRRVAGADLAARARPARPARRLYAGVEPAALFRSDDGGRTSRSSAGCGTTRTGRRGSLAAAGCASTRSSSTRPIRTASWSRSPPPASTVSDDGGALVAGEQPRDRPGFLPAADPEFGQCVHKVARDAGDPERLYLQHHGGIYRSDDGGGSWVRDDGHRRHGLRLPRRRPPDAAGHRLPPPARERRVPLHARRPLHRVADDDGGESWEPLTTDCPSATPTSRCCATGSRPTAATRPASTSAPAPARCTPPSTTATRGGSSPSTCRRCCRSEPPRSAGARTDGGPGPGPHPAA